jgi:hypothetical protein
LEQHEKIVKKKKKTAASNWFKIHQKAKIAED